MAKKNLMHGDPMEGPLNVRISKEESSQLAVARPAIPQGIKRVISLCQISKIFNPYCNVEKYLEDPDLVEQEEVFEVVIQGSWATESYKYGEPCLISDLKALQLVGVDNSRFEPSTGWTGLVFFDIPEDLLAAFTYLKRTNKPVDREIEAKLKEHLDAAKALSRRRVIDYLKNRYNDSIAGRKSIKQFGGEPGAPEDIEILISFILRAEIQRSKAMRQKLRREWEEANKEILGSI
jgi:hypothetical protein